MAVRVRFCTCTLQVDVAAMSHPRNETPPSTWTILVLSSLKESPPGASHAARRP